MNEITKEFLDLIKLTAHSTFVCALVGEKVLIYGDIVTGNELIKDL